jgi:hypothetical protein
LLAFASVGSPTGYVCDAKGRQLTLEEIARVCNGTPDEVAKHIVAIEEKGAASRDRTGRLFNRRMVRDAKLQAKRAQAGLKGAAHTNLINQQLRAAYKILPRQVMRQKSTGPPPPLPSKKENINLSSENSAARAREDAPALQEKMPTEIPETVGSLATALLDGALTRQPSDRASEKKRPDQLSRAELEASFARKRSANGKGKPLE